MSDSQKGQIQKLRETSSRAPKGGGRNLQGGGVGREKAQRSPVYSCGSDPILTSPGQSSRLEL